MNIDPLDTYSIAVATHGWYLAQGLIARVCSSMIGSKPMWHCEVVHPARGRWTKMG